MATKAPAKKAATKADDDIDALAAEIEGEVGEAHEFESGADAPDGDGHGGIDWVGKTVKLTDQDGNEVEGKVIKHHAEAEQVDVEGEHAVYEEVAIKDVALVGEEAPAEAKPAGKKGKAPKAETNGNGDGEQAEPLPPEDQIRTLKIADVKIPAKKVRAFREDERFNRLMADIKERKQQYPIKVTSFDKPVLADGMRRLQALQKLGFTEVRAILDVSGSDDDVTRVWNGLLDNEQRENMHWLDLANAFALITKDGAITQRKIAKSLGMQESEVSRMIGAAAKLPKKVLEFAKTDHAYPASVFTELADCAEAAPEVVDHVMGYMEEGRGVTQRDVRALKKDHEQEKKRAEKEAAKAAGKEDEGEEEQEDGRSAGNRAPAAGATYRGLPSSETGPKLKVVVHKDHIEFRVSVDWKRKTMAGIEVMKEIKAVFDENFRDESTTLDSFDTLAKSMTSARAELG